MTVETTTARVTYTGAGTTGPFSVPFYFLEDDDLTVIKTTIADGTETTLVLTTDYVVSGAADEAGGSVTLTASLSSAYKLTIIRDPDLLQSSDYPSNDKFPATTHERVVDKLTMIAQRLKDLINRSFRLSDGDVSGISLSLSNLSASKLIAVNSAGTALEAIAAADVGLTPVSDFAATLIDDADAATARATLGAAGLAANTFTGVQRWAKGADVASASALTLGTDGNYFDITGTTTITSIGSLGVGTWVKLHFDGALTLTHHATDLVLAGGANITTAAGDEIEFAEYASGDWRMVGGVKADGTAWVGGGANVAVAGTFALSGDISPAQITADQNDYNPTGLSSASTLRLTSDASRNVTGLQGGADGRVLVLHNVGSNNIVLKDESASSTAGNRFALSADITLGVDQAAVLQYDATSSRWRVMAAQSSGSATITLGTPQATTSGTSIDFTSIPSGTKMIIVNLNGVSTSGTSIALVQLGDSGGVENTGYSGSTANTLYTDGARLYTTWAASTIAHGTITIVLINSSTKTWAITGVLGYSNAGLSNILGYTKSLSADLDRIRLTTVGGTDTFDAGEINILYFG